MRMRILVLLGILAALGSGVGALADSAQRSYSPRVTNPWFPLERGAVYVYTGVKDGQPARDVVTVTDETKLIDGVPCAVVEDRLYLRGRLRERTTDWYTQDSKGNVYIGDIYGERCQKFVPISKR